MIRNQDIVEIGRFLKTHGISGEIVFSPLYDLDMLQLRCIVIEIDGIFVPFFIESQRPKGSENLLLKIADINNEKEAAELTNKTVYALADDVDIADNSDLEEGFSALDFIGYRIIDGDTGNELGVVDYIDDTTSNWLFMVKPAREDAKNMIAIPVADEFIADIDTDNRLLKMFLPTGLLEL